MQPPETQSVAFETRQPRRTVGMRLQVILGMLLISVIAVFILGAQCKSLCSSEPSNYALQAVRQHAVVDQADMQYLDVWVDVAVTGVYSPALTSGAAVLGSLLNGDQVQGLPSYLDELAKMGYLAIRVPHAPPDYHESSLVPDSFTPYTVAFRFYMPPDAPDGTTVPVGVKRVPEYEAIVNQKYPITDGRSHWEVWWIDGDEFPIPGGTFQLKDEWPQAIEVMFSIDFGSGASAYDCAGCPIELLFYNGYTFIGPYRAPLIIETSSPTPGNPLVTFDMCPNQFGSRVEYITPAVPFTHTHWLRNHDVVTRTFTITASSSQGWGYTWYSGPEGGPLAKAPGLPFEVQIGPNLPGWYPTCARILAVLTPTIAVTDTMRETLLLTATSTVSHEVWAHTFSIALAPGYQLKEDAGNRTYLPAVLRQ